LTPFFPAIDSPELDGAVAKILEKVGELEALFDANGIGGEGGDAENAGPVLDDVLERLNRLLEELRVVRGYVYGHVAVDSRNEAAQARLSELLRERVRLTNLETRLTAWIGGLDLDSIVERSETARAHEFALRRAQIEARHLMSGPEEQLAAELDQSGATAWGRLHGDVTSQILVRLELDGREQELPMSEVRNLATNPNRDTRRGAFEAELAAWERNAVPLAGALNSIKGQVNTLAARRHWDSPLDAALFANAVDRDTLDAMFGAVREALPELHEYARAKARLLGLDRLAWYDLMAPVSDGGGRSWSFEEAREFILDQFGTYSDRLRDFADRAFSERWIDAEPRTGKRDGAFCMSVRGEESRILSNYSPSYFEVSTLAHELGHGYHQLAISERTIIQQDTPMTLAETASTFCETIVRYGALSTAGESKSEQLQILEAFLETAFGVTVDILSRFLFEQSVFERRRQRALSVNEISELMLEAQEQTYGDAIDPDTRHQFAWAGKPHYYSSYSFYNFPYTFGLLFGLGLYARYTDDPDEFRAGYDELLSSTGLADAATLAARFGIDTRAADFWRSSLDVVRADIETYKALADGS
jgi:pepF/M3 family oligoendopeptidase